MNKVLKIFLVCFALLIVLLTFASALKVGIERIRKSAELAETSELTTESVEDSRHGLVDGGANTETQWGKMYYLH